MTNRDYPGTIYYTIRNVSLYECLGWCRDEVDCHSAAFSFVVNPLTPIQETTCLLQNETLSTKKPSTGLAGQSGSYSQNGLQKAVNMYFFSKIELRSGKSSLFCFPCSPCPSQKELKYNYLSKRRPVSGKGSHKAFNLLKFCFWCKKKNKGSKRLTEYGSHIVSASRSSVGRMQIWTEDQGHWSVD